MRRLGAFAIAAFAVLSAASLQADTALPAVLRILGSVTVPAGPAEHALVIALNLEDFAAVQTYSRGDGTFALPNLKGGIYRIIAVKQGFIPAITTIVPTRADYRLTLRMADEKSARGRSRTQEIWEIRGSLPPDVLREVDAVLNADVATPYEIPRLRGEMVSMTAVGDETAGAAFAQTALGVQSRLSDRWQLGFRGNMQRVGSPIDSAALTSPVAESSVMSMEIRSGANETLRLASAKSWWLYRDAVDAGDRQADMQAHNVEWEHGATRLQIRYLAQANLHSPSPFDSDVIEIGGDTPLLQGGRTELGVSLRVVQESIRGVASGVISPAEIVRTADVGANGTFMAGRSLLIQYGVASRIGLEQTAWAPRTGAEWKVAKKTSLFASGMYKVQDDTDVSRIAMMTAWGDESRFLPRYSYSAGVASRQDENNQVSVAYTVTEMDAPLRVMFGTGFDQFWEGFYLDRGDRRRDVTMNARTTWADRFAVDVSASAGAAAPEAADGRKSYVTGDLQSTFLPTRTSLLVSYRDVRQPHPVASSSDYRSERMNVRFAQSLYLPIDLNVLLGVEVAKAWNSPFLTDQPGESEARRYVGGLALKF